jgi:SnoaL-like domain
MEQEMRRLIDEAAIKDVMIRYCRGIDRRDWELVRSCFHADAIDDHGEGEFVGGMDAFMEYAKAGTLNFESTSHLTCNQMVRIDGESAWVENYVLAYHRVAATADEPAKDLIANARVVDRLERRNGEWRIVKRISIVDSARAEPVLDPWTDPVAQVRGRRDRSDPSYSA